MDLRDAPSLMPATAADGGGSSNAGIISSSERSGEGRVGMGEEAEVAAAAAERGLQAAVAMRRDDDMDGGGGSGGCGGGLGEDVCSNSEDACSPAAADPATRFHHGASSD